MSAARAHVIVHTHWDREWFLTSAYTSAWLPGLIDRLEELVAANPDFQFFFDGQTLVVEDLLLVAPDYAGRVQRLIAAGNLIVGPYYCQPDWQLTGGELLLRNLLLGREDVARYGGKSESGWLVDTFGHIRQSPQLHRLFNIDALYVWRGVPCLEPYFDWVGPDGSRLLTINLFGGYRNLYGVSHAPEVAVRRLQAEIAKLQPFYPTPDIPLFDGYDLEDNPEDPVSFYATFGGIGPGIELQAATPASFAAHVRGLALSLPEAHSELNSGKYGATFPGTLSTRTYLKIMAGDCERLLFGLCEPLAALAWLRGRPYDALRYERWSRLLLQNAVHDCLCGVSIDEVHEKMEDGYRRAFEAMTADVEASLQAVLAAFAPGLYAIGAQPFPTESWQAAGDQLLRVKTDGVGVWPVEEAVPIASPNRVADSLRWQNEHYEAEVLADGTVRLGAAILGRLLVYAEHGDTYSEQRGQLLGELHPAGPLVVEQESAVHAVVRYDAMWQDRAASVTAAVRIWLDRSPLVRWQVELDSRGTDLRVEMEFATGRRGAIWAGMPFDVAPREPVDDDLLPRKLPADLSRVLLGQRELHAVITFPFHDFVAIGDEKGSAAVFARGLHAYRAGDDGAITLLLRRAVEWLTRSNLPDREGDAGPAFYVPGARGERWVRHDLAFAAGSFAPDSPELLALNGVFQQPALLVRREGSGVHRQWPLFQERLPLSSLHVRNRQAVIRIANPTAELQPLSRRYTTVDVQGRELGAISAVPPYQIASLRLEAASPEATAPDGDVRLLAPPRWRVGPNAAQPDPAVLDELQRQMAALDVALAALEDELARSAGPARLRLEHRLYVLQRQRLELQLSHLLNSRKLAGGGEADQARLYERDEEIAALGLALNRLRIKRRIFDYVVQAI